jgi:hypothetical protein
MSLLSRVKTGVLSLPRKEASFSRRRFPGIDSPSRPHLEAVLNAFIDGYNVAVAVPDTKELCRRLDSSFSSEFVGFAYEGSGLYFALMDLMIPGSKRLDKFTRGSGKPHDYIAMVGAGFAIARIPLALVRMEGYQKSLDGMSAWCVADGYGFHEGFFKWRRYVDGTRPAPASLTLQNRRLYDSGVGRAMWWVYGADPKNIAAGISRFAPERRAEMWSGIGTALAYAGGGPAGAAAMLCSLAGEYQDDLRSGLPFAAHMRVRAGNPAECTTKACMELLNLSVRETSDLILGEVNSYLANWKGSEDEKWKGCYLNVREQVKLRLTRSRTTSAG